MKKSITISFLMVFCLSAAFGQLAFEDAKAIRPYLQSNGASFKFSSLDSDDGYLKILMKYMGPDGASDSLTRDSVAVYYRQNNPFLKQYFNPPGGLSFEDDEQELFKSDVQTSVNQGKGLSSKDFLLIFVDLLIERTKKELTITFFEKFKNDLQEFEELKVLFPETHQILNSIGYEIYNYNNYINMLRKAFQKDLKIIIPNLKRFVESGLLGKYKGVNNTVERIFDNALLIAEELHGGVHPGELLTSLAKNNSNENDKINNLGPSLKLLDLVSQSLRSKEDKQYWVSSNELKELLEDDLTLSIYLGLLYEKSPEITFKSKNTEVKFKQTILVDLSEKINENKKPIRDFLKGLISNAQTIDQNLKSIRTRNNNGDEGDNPKYEERHAFFTSSIDFLHHALKIFEIPAIDNAINFNTNQLEKYFKIAGFTNDLYLDVVEQDLVGALKNIHDIFDTAIFDNSPTINTLINNEIKGLTTAIPVLKTQLENSSEEQIQKLESFFNTYKVFKINRQFNTLLKRFNILKKEKLNVEKIKEINVLLDDVLISVSGDSKKQLVERLKKRYEGILPKLFKYGNLVIGIAEAKTSEEVHEIIDGIVSGTGGATTKKRTKSAVALNAYVGLSVGSEFNNGSQVYDFFGVSAPIGVNMSWSHRGLFTKDITEDNDAASSIFVTLIDLGAVTSFRFGNDQEVELPDIELENIFAPGLYYVYGFPRVPISFGLGGQLGPQLRGITEDGTDLSSELSFSFRAFLAVDIPLLNFRTKSR